MKTKTFTKILSGILCSALTMQIVWGVKREQVNADGTIGVSSVGYGTVLTVDTTNSGTSQFIITSSGGKYHIENQSPASGSLSSTDLTEISKIVIDGWAIANINTDITTSIEFNDASASLYIEQGTLTATNISGTGYQLIVYDNGTLKCGDFIGENFRNFTSVLFYGTLKADNIDFTNTNGSYITTTDYGKYIVTSSFTNGTRDIYGTVIAEPDTTISSAGGSFTLQVGSATKEITGTFTNKKPADLFDDPFSFGAVHDVYYGQEYDFSDLITVADGYDKSVTLEYSSDGVNYSTTKPTAQSPNNYYVRAVAPDSGTFLGKTTDPQTYKINYLEYSDLFPSGSKTYSSVSGIVNGKYVPGDLVITMPNGILIKGDTFDSDKDFSNTITLTPEVVLNDYGGVNVDETVQFRDTNNDNATTAGNISIAQFYPELLDLVYDLYDPDIWLSSVDGEFVDEDITTSLTGDDLEFRIYDDNLKAIYVNGELYSVSLFA